VQQARLLQPGSPVQKDAGAGAGRMTAPPTAPPRAAAASVPLKEDVVMEEADPLHAPMHPGHSAGVRHEPRGSSRVVSHQAVTKRPPAGFGRQAQQQQPYHSLPQPSVARQAPAAGGLCSSTAGARIQLSSVLLQLADPTYSAEAAQQDFMAWEAALGSG
jgi:hypothetical protein